MNVLITGGLGFIGSFTAKRLTEAGHQVVILDNLSFGQEERGRWGTIHIADIRSRDRVVDILRKDQITAVLHLAACAHAGESVLNPAPYFSNNVSGTFTLLDAMAAAGVERIVFASSCAVYGNMPSARLSEDEEARPVSPYGESKLMCERALEAYGRAYGVQSISLRYFNVAGASPILGEDLVKSPRLLPHVIRAAMTRQPIDVYGTTFATVDGTAVRDYVHVEDVARANLLALQYLEAGGGSAVLNIGTGSGTSVTDLIHETERIVNQPIRVRYSAPRPGDPERAISDSTRAWDTLKWRPQHSSVEEIVRTAVAYYEARCAQNLLTAT